MTNPSTSLLVAGQLPEFYREEAPQLILFLEKYYEYLETTKTGRVSDLRNVDASLNAFISNLKDELSKNVPSFGNVPAEEFLKVAKQFYTARGSEDSFVFLIRAMFGKTVDLLYPGEKILKASDGVWVQEVSIYVNSTSDLTIVDGNRFLLKRSQGAQGPSLLSTKVKKITNSIYEIFIDKSYDTLIASGDIFEYVNGVDTIVGSVVDRITSVDVLNGGSSLFAGAAFIVPSVGLDPSDCIIRITAMDKVFPGSISKMDVLSSGNGFTAQTYVLLRNQSRSAIDVSSSLQNFLLIPGYQVGDAYIKLNTYPIMRYRGFYSNTRGFLSDDIKLQDGVFYQPGSYVLRLDEQLDAYKSAIMTLLHPDGMAVWGQFDLSNKIDISVELIAAAREFLQRLQDISLATDNLSHNTILAKSEHTNNIDFLKHDTILQRTDIANSSAVSNHNTTLVKTELTNSTDSLKHSSILNKPETVDLTETLTFSVSTKLLESINNSDSGSLILLSGPDYTSDASKYLEGVLVAEVYTSGSSSITRSW